MRILAVTYPIGGHSDEHAYLHIIFSLSLLSIRPCMLFLSIGWQDIKVINFYFFALRWLKLIQKPFEEGDERGMKLVQSILKPIMLRRTKSSTDRDGR